MGGRPHGENQFRSRGVRPTLSRVTDLEFYDDPAEFLATAARHLGADPVLNTVVASVTSRARDEDSAGVARPVGVPRWWVAARDAGGEVVGVGMRTATAAPYPLYLLPMPRDAAVGLARALHARVEEATGFNGALPAAEWCAGETARLVGGEARIVQQSRLFELDDLVVPADVPGRLRAATPDDVELALAWFLAFHHDADEQAGRAPTSDPVDLEDRGGMLRRIQGRRVWFWVTEEGQRVNLTGANPPSFGVARVGPVYTPPEHRRRGYPGAAVAEVSRLLLHEGARVCLFTDQANPTSNRIYRQLGFRPLVDMANLLVSRSA